jgi:hypothetical protein
LARGQDPDQLVSDAPEQGPAPDTARHVGASAIEAAEDETIRAERNPGSYTDEWRSLLRDATVRKLRDDPRGYPPARPPVAPGRPNDPNGIHDVGARR